MRGEVQTARAILSRPFRPPLVEAVAAFSAVGGASVALAAALPFEGGLPVWIATGVYALAAGVALGHVGAHHGHARLGGANHVTILRLGGVAVFAALAAEPGILAGDAAWLALAAALGLLVLDGIDGWIARRQRLESDFGARFDMEVDALLILVLAVIAYTRGDAGVWVLGLGLARYGFVIAGWVWPRLAQPLPPSLRRKTICVVQVATLTVLLAPAVAPPWSDALAAVAFATLAWSFTVDIRWLLARTGP